MTRSGTALGAILALATALRFVGIEYGLPFGGLLNPDEQNIVPRAWAMVHGAGADPHWFDYPTLTMYLLAPFQAWHSEPSYLTARVTIVVLALGGIAASWWLGRRAYGTVAAVGEREYERRLPGALDHGCEIFGVGVEVIGAGTRGLAGAAQEVADDPMVDGEVPEQVLERVPQAEELICEHDQWAFARFVPRDLDAVGAFGEPQRGVFIHDAQV